MNAVVTSQKSNAIKSHFKASDLKIYPYIEQIDFNQWLNPQRDHFRTLTRSIISQQLSGKAADTIINRFVSLLPHNIIAPEHILAVSEQLMRDAGLSWAKVSYVKDLATKVVNHEVHLEKLELLSDQEVIEELTKVKGIGTWTAVFLMFSLHREDIFSHKDLGLRRGIEKIYQLQDPSKDQIDLIVERWSPFKSYGSIALWFSLDN